MRKKFIAVLIALALCLPLCIPASAEGIELSFEAGEDGEAYVPLRAACEALGATVVIWDPATCAATVEAPGIVITAVEGERWFTANGRYLFASDGVHISGDSMVVPAAAIAKIFGASVTVNDWTVTFSAPGEPIAPAGEYYGEEDLYWLSRIIQAEAGSESLDGKIGVGNVVMNRIESDEFPNTVKGVIFDRKYGVQFTPTSSGTIYCTPSGESVAAAKLALDGANTAGASLYFSTAGMSSWAKRNRPVFGRIDGQDFFL